MTYIVCFSKKEKMTKFSQAGSNSPFTVHEQSKTYEWVSSFKYDWLSNYTVKACEGGIGHSNKDNIGLSFCTLFLRSGISPWWWRHGSWGQLFAAGTQWSWSQPSRPPSPASTWVRWSKRYSKCSPVHTCNNPLIKEVHHYYYTITMSTVTRQGQWTHTQRSDQRGKTQWHYDVPAVMGWLKRSITG